jgi:hypothetical protein
MNFPWQYVGAGILAPAAIAAATASLVRRFLPEDVATRYAMPLGFAAAYCAAFVLLADGDELLPQRHWHWTLYLAPLAAAIGAVAVATGLHRAERWLLFALIAFISAWLLVPTWPSLRPARPIAVPLLAGYLLLLAAALEPLTRRFSSLRILAALAPAAGCVAALIAASVSVTYAGPSGAAATALAGCLGAAYYWPSVPAVRALSLGYAVVVGGWAYIGCIEPQQPLVGLLLAPLAPLALWCCALGPLARLRGPTAAAVQIVSVMVPLALSAALVLNAA